MSGQVSIFKGLKFKSASSRWEAQVSAIREDKNQLDVILTDSSGNGWGENNWNFQHVKESLSNGSYEILPAETNFGI